VIGYAEAEEEKEKNQTGFYGRQCVKADSFAAQEGQEADGGQVIAWAGGK
jgi:hypothetical protein